MLVDLVIGQRRSMAVRSVLIAGLAARSSGVGLGSLLGEGGGLAFGLTLGGFEGAGQFIDASPEPFHFLALGFHQGQEFVVRGCHPALAVYAGIVSCTELCWFSAGTARVGAKQAHAITLFVEDEAKHREGKYGWLNHLVNFIVYQSRVRYNEYCNWLEDEEESFRACEEAGATVVFNLERRGPGGIKKIGDVWVSMGTEPCRLEVERALFDDFHKLIDRSLAIAITYFLLGCENPRYFLVEYYKSVEVLSNEFGEEAKMLAALSPYGLSKQMFKTLTRHANNALKPISFGRHAPNKNAYVLDLDIRSLMHPETIQHELFAESTKICRAAIDAYVTYLRARR